MTPEELEKRKELRKQEAEIIARMIKDPEGLRKLVEAMNTDKKAYRDRMTAQMKRVV